MKKQREKIVSSFELDKYSSLIKPLLEQIVKETGFEFCDLTFENENQTSYLRITIQSTKGSITLDDCEVVSRAIGKELDTKDKIPFHYVLEVQSTGINSSLDESKEPQHEFFLEKAGLTVRS